MTNFTKLAKMKALPVQHTISLATEARKLPNGSQFYLPTSTLNLSEKVRPVRFRPNYVCRFSSLGREL